MLFNNEKKCLVFVRQEDATQQNEDREEGSLVVYPLSETFSKEKFRSKNLCFDLGLRFEWVSDRLNNVFQVCSQAGTKLYACGYPDNSVRVFDLEQKPGQHLVRLVCDHAGPVRCLKFSHDSRYFLSCDANGAILHYERNTLRENFPYRLLFKI